MPHINDDGLAIIEFYEGLRLRAYPDPGTGGEPWTIGYGHTVSVHPGQDCTIAQAQAFLRADVATAERAVESAVQVVLTPNQFSALVSFEYNTGAPSSATIFSLVNQKRFDDAQAEFSRWVYANGTILQGLVSRRADEAKLFGTPA